MYWLKILLNYRIQGHFSNYSNWSGSLARQSIPKVYYSNGSLARQSIPKVYYSNGSRARKSIPRYIIQMAQWLVGSPVDSLVSLAKFLWLFWSCMWALVTHIKTYRHAFTFYKYTFLRRIRWFDKFSAVAIKEENTLYNSSVVSHLLS